ncbi:hypothetical protein BGZ75_008761 [Mortierella antarctica]|nr:hypothetical protein BGZ75_008761 [Mortierella antarctica]
MTSDALGPSTRTNPLELYEILSVVLSFLDRPSLLQAGLVCSSWHTCSQPILQQTCAILNQDLLGFFSPPSTFDVARTTQWHAAQFVHTCHRVRSLRIGSILEGLHSDDSSFNYYSASKLPMERLPSLYQFSRAYQIHPGLKNLVHLDIHYCDDGSKFMHGREERQEAFYAIMYKIILDNDSLRDLEFTDAGGSVSILFERLCDLKVAHRVQRLSIKTDAFYFRFRTLLAELNNANAASSTGSADEQEQGAGAEPWTLQELVLHSARAPMMGRLSLEAKTASCESYPVIRSLTLLDFDLYREARESDDDTDHGEIDTEFIDPKLYFMQQCPNLERLRISYDLPPSSQASRKSFSECVLSQVPEIENTGQWMEPPCSFVQEMFRACPKLKAIDLGGNVDLSRSHWEEMMGVYGRQLESFVVWGVLNFTAEALVHLLGPHPSNAMAESPRNFRAMSQLTELDISWAGGVDTCAWLVFSTLPCLRHFKARQIPLDAARLVGYDWVCKGLETLAIQVLVPMQQWPLERVQVGGRIVEPWLSKESHGGHTKATLCKGSYIPETSTSPESQQEGDEGDHDDVDDDDDGYAEKFASKRVRVQESDKERKKAKKAKKERKQSMEGKHKKERRQSTEGKDKKEARKEKKERKKSKENKRPKKRKHCQQSDADSDLDSEAGAGADTESVIERSQSIDTISHKALKESQPPKPYYMQIQVDLCEQLGRLHRLRELTLEGQRDCRYYDREWDCMHLTLQTGLDRLEPLQNSLEKLVLYQLQDELAGDQEVEWIAQHWIHHQNPVWQQDFRRRKQSYSDILAEEEEEEDVKDDLWRPEPKFKELLGIGVRPVSSYSSALRAHANLAWLKQECPRLRIEKDHRVQDDDFYFGNFEDY